MLRKLYMFALSVLAACIMAAPCYADFSVSDSLNLMYCETYLSGISSYVSKILVDFDKYYSFAVSEFTNIGSNVLSISSTLSTIETYLSKLSGSSYTAFDLPFTFDSSTCYTKNPINGYITDGIWVGFSSYQPGVSTPSLRYYLPAGHYFVAVQSLDSVQPSELTWESGLEGQSYYTINNLLSSGYRDGAYFWLFDFTLDEPRIFWNLFVYYPGGGIHSCIAYVYDSNSSSDVGASLNSSFGDSLSSGADDIQSSVDSISAKENEMFTSFDSTIESFDFTGSSLSQMAGSFSFIGAVFTSLFNVHPVVSVVLNVSMMFGVLALFLRISPRLGSAYDRRSGRGRGS